MIESLYIRGFQKHRKRKIEFDPEVTTIIGRSDLGKSTIIRILRWLSLNKGPKRIVSLGMKFTKVKAVIDGHTLIRHKAKGTNLYVLDNESYKALGLTGVPDDVSKFLNMGDINFQRQLDEHFWFSLTPGQVSKELNQIVNLTAIDQSMENISKKSRRCKVELDLINERLEEARTKKKKLFWVKEFDRDLKKIESLQEVIDRRAAQIENLTLVIEKGKKLDKDIANATRATAGAAVLLKKAESIDVLTARMSMRAEKIIALEKLIQGHDQCQKKIEYNQRLIGKIGRQLTKLAKRCPLCGALLKKSVQS